MGRDRKAADPSAERAGDPMLDLAELVDAATLQSMMEDFYAITRIPMAMIDLEGVVVVGAGWQEACTRFHRVNPESCANCIKSDTILSAGVEPGESKVYRCENGMWDAATPIVVGGQRVGNLFTGQFFFDDESIDLDFFRKQAARYGFEMPAYLDAVQSVPRLSRATVEIGLRFLTNLSGMISQLSYSNYERARVEAGLHDALATQTELAGELESERGVLQAIMENTDTHLAYLDPEFNFVMVNSTYARGSGFSVEELLGRNHFDLFPNEENQAIFERARATGEPVEFRDKPFEFPGQPWRGVTYWDWLLTPVHDRDGNLQGLAFSLQDVTRAFRQRAFSDTINRLDDMIHSDLDIEGVLAHILPELAAATGAEAVAVALRSPGGRWAITELFGLPDTAKDATFSDDELPVTTGALRCGRPVVASVEEDVPTVDMLRNLGARSILVAPLSVPGRELGAVVYAYLSGPGEFDERVVDFAGKTAASLSLALNNADLFHDAMHSARLSGTLAKVNEILLSAITLDDVMSRLVDEVSVVAGADKSLVIDVGDDVYTITNVRNVSRDLVGVPHDASYYPAFALAAAQGQPVLVQDNWSDPRTNKDFVVPNELRAFQLLPLTVQGRVAKVLALAYDEPRTFDAEDFLSAGRMSAAMSVALDNARLYENEHRIADRLQEALLALPREIDGLAFAHAYHAASDGERVGGDFYDVFDLGHNQIGITIGDVAGKGLDAAVLTSLAKNAIRAHASESGKTPARILALTNDIVYRATGSEAFATLFFGILDSADGRFVYANAGHPAAMVVSPGCVTATLPASGPPVGAFEVAGYGESELCLGLQDVLFLYTDGLTEARSRSGFYGDDRLQDILTRSCGGSVTGLVEDVISDVLTFSEGRLRDDLAILAATRRVAV